MTEYRVRKAEQNELADCRALANLVFGVDFQTLLPKVYGEKPTMQAAHYVAEEDGKLKGLAAVLGDCLTVGEITLKTGYVGSVCVHPDTRGQGLMSKVMHCADSGMASDGTDIAFLNGNRQRYQYYGFFPAGISYFFSVTGGDFKHALKDVPAEHIRFEEICSGSGLERQAREGYCSKPVHFERKDFVSLCCSYYNKPYAVLDKGEFIGYVVANGDKNCWSEICVKNAEALDLTVKAWMAQNGVWNLQIVLPEWETGLCRHLVGYASGMKRGYSVQAKIYHFKKVAEAYLKRKADRNGITDGRMAFDIAGERFEIIVENGTVSVGEGGENPLKLTACEANRLLLMPFPYEGMPEAPGGWFPLGISDAPDAPDAF